MSIKARDTPEAKFGCLLWSDEKASAMQRHSPARFGVLLGLVARAEHGFVPAAGATLGGAALAGRGVEESGLFDCVAALFGFEDEAAAFVEVDAAGGGGAVGVAEGDGAFEDVGVGSEIARGGLGAGDVEEVGEFGKEELVVSAFSGGGGLPAGYEGGGHRRVLASVARAGGGVLL